MLAAPHIFQPGLCFRVYHYTNRAGYSGIVRSGAIRPSDIKQGDASYGPGVYGTKLPPSSPFWDILKNNYDGDGGIIGRGEDKSDRAEYVFQFDVSDDDIVKVIDDSETRSVVVYGGGRAVSLREAVAYGRAADVAKLEEADKRLEEMLKEDDDLRYLLFGEDLPFEGSYELEFWYMDQLNYAKFMAGCNFLHGLTILNSPRIQRVGPDGLCLDEILGLVGFDKVVVRQWRPRSGGWAIVFMGDLCDLGGFYVQKSVKWPRYLSELRDLALATLEHAVKLCERHLPQIMDSFVAILKRSLEDTVEFCQRHLQNRKPEES